MRTSYSLSNETNLALPELAIALVGHNFASHQVRDGSLYLASGETTPAYSSHKADVYGITLSRSKSKLAYPGKLRLKHHVALIQPSHTTELI